MALLYIERQRNPEVSFALWFATVWVLICGSRPIAGWLDPNEMPSGQYGNFEAGSPVDRFALSVLILIALFVITKRKISWSLVFKYNAGLLIVYILIGYSTLWADFPYVSFKRWVKIFGTIVMSILVLSERKPDKALESLLLRTAYILVPFSLLLIKYFPHFGVNWDRWTGDRIWVGVSTQKNGLGQITAISSMILIWLALRKWRTGEFFKNKMELFADILVLSLAVFMLRGSEFAYSATSIAILIVAVFLLMILSWRENLTNWVAANLKLMIASLGVIIFLVFNIVIPIVTSALGRDESLTGRTEIWNSLLDAASRHPWFGVGYGGFWARHSTGIQYGVMQGHNGYLDVLLDLGVFGIVLLTGFLFSFCGKIQREWNRSLDWGVLGICYLIVVLLYNISESSFFTNNYLWTVFVFITMIFSQNVKKENAEGLLHE